MALKEYICPRWPEYGIGMHVKFVDGWFRTDNPELQALVESNDMYGIRIWNAAGEGYYADQRPEEEAETVGEGGEGQAPEEGQVGGEEGEGGLPASQPEGPHKGAGASKVKPGRGDGEGRKASPALSEIEELVKGSGILH
jgi:hypothetical protein